MNNFAVNSLIFIAAIYVLIFFASLLLFLILIAYGWSKISRYLKARRKQTLERLANYNHRLKRVVSHLLARANDIDQGSMYIEGKASAEWSKSIANACTKLVLLTDTVQLIGKQIDTGDIQLSRKHMLESVRIARQISSSLDGLERELSSPGRDKKRSGSVLLE